MGLLNRQRPGVHIAVVKVLALITEGTRGGPGLDDELVGLVEEFTVESGVGVVGELLGAGTPHEARHQPPARNHVDFGKFLCQLEGVGNNRQGIT